MQMDSSSMWRKTLVTIVTLLAASARAQEPSDCVALSDNPWGECDCDGQIFLGPDCTQAYICEETEPDIYGGCIIECPSGNNLVPDFGTDGTNVQWSCRDESQGNCPGSMQVYCAGGDDAVPDDGLANDDANIRCQCDGQIFISPDCQHADTCRLEGEDEYELRNAADCINDDHIVMDFFTWEYVCSSTVNNCPGNGGFSLGCTVGAPFIPYDPECEYTDKPISTFSDEACGSCDNQMFINEDCTQGFLCMDQVPPEAEDQDAEGCLMTCDDGYKIFAEFPDDGTEYVSFRCIAETELPGCPGEFFVNCEGDDIVPADELCTCEGQLFVSPDCNVADQCISRGAVDVFEKREIDCPGDQIVQISDNGWDISCQDASTNRCPGKGGFTWGCSNSANDDGCSLLYDQDGGDMGTCDGCNGKQFINADCSAGLLCNEEIQNPDLYDGCGKICYDGEILVQDLLVEDGWACLSTGVLSCKDVGYETACPDDDTNYDAGPSDCIGPSDVIVTKDCTSGYSCENDMSITCNSGEVLIIRNIPVIDDIDYDCLPNTIATCPPGGGYRYGAFSDDSITTSTTSTTTIEGFPPDECVEQDNPLGECYGCDLQVFINVNCTQGFVCSGNDQEGCLYSCPDGNKLVPNFANDGTEISWLCVPEEGHVCPGEFKIYCPDDDDAVPITGISPSDVERCECDGELFVSPDCKHADRCSAVGVDSYVIRNAGDCEDDETILINFVTWETSCATDVDNCPGQGGFALGATTCSPNIPVDPICDYTEKPFTDDIACGCDNQVFINSDCTMGFKCQDSLPDIAPDEAEGCLVTCDVGQRIYPEFSNGNVNFYCVAEDQVACPGEYNLNCQIDPIDPPNEECTCDGELFVSPDCSEARLCRQIGVDEYALADKSCEDGQVLNIDTQTWSADCQDEDLGNCPGLGGFHWGCGEGNPNAPYCAPGSPGADDTNGIGTCECDGMVLINTDCSYGLYCDANVPDSEEDLYAGCALSCSSGEILVQDLHSSSSVGFVCAPVSQVECVGGAYTAYSLTDDTCGTLPDLSAPATEADCTCNGEILVRAGCSNAFRCDDTIQGGGTRATCDSGTVLQVINREINDWSVCSSIQDEGVECPVTGGYNYGCFEGYDEPTTTTTKSTTTSTTTSTTPDSNTSSTTTTTSTTPDSNTSSATTTTTTTTTDPDPNTGSTTTLPDGVTTDEDDDDGETPFFTEGAMGISSPLLPLLLLLSSVIALLR